MDKAFVRGQGSWLWDKTGRRYLDFLAQYGALPFGFNPPEIWAAVNAIRQSGEPSFVQPSYSECGRGTGGASAGGGAPWHGLRDFREQRRRSR